MKKLLYLILLFSVTGTAFSFTAAESVSDSTVKITQYVTDETGILTSQEINQLRQTLKNFEDSTSNQIVVYIIKSLNGMPIEMVSYDIAEKNGIGQRGKNNGALLLIAMNDRRMRIEVGYGLEGALPDALCGRIINDEITPSFKNENYYEGIVKGVNAIMSATKGEYKPGKSEKEQGICIGPGLFITLFIGFIIILIVIEILKGIFGFGRVYSGSKGSKSSGWNSGGWWWGSGGSGGSGGFGGGSSGGFSGGGGSFGGGGASGGW
ncbi:MAG: TPM domain-containing protein [Ignavibacteria bacterium]|nr:TPM domain-containing protein [Ignavibacteria bacterium]